MFSFLSAARARTERALFSAGVSTLALLFHVGPAHGEDSAPSALEEVIVTAERRETNLQDTPIAITALNASALEERDVDSIRDLAGQIPNLSISRVTISHTTQTYSLRGVGESDPIQEPVLAVYVDDVYLPRQLGSMIEFNDLERLEVLRGPQGTLYGRNSSAGALRIITRDPDDEFRLKAELGYGDYDATEVRGLVSGPLLEDRLAGSLSYIHYRRDGVTENPTLGRDVNRISLDSVRGKLRWTPGQDLDVQLTINALRDRSDTRGYVPVDQPGDGFDPRVTYSEVDPKQDLDQISGALRVRYDVTPALEIKSVSSYGGFNLNPVNYDNDGEAALKQKNLIHYNDQYYTQELQLNGAFERLTFSTGLFYLHERFYVKRDGYTRTNNVTPFTYNFLRAKNVTNTDAYALFGEATFKVTDALSLTAGLRYTVEEKEFVFDNKTLNIDGAVTGQSIAGEADAEWDAKTPKLSLQYAWTPDLLTYLTYSKGFKAGGFDNRATRLDLATLPFDPENVASYEAGLKSDFFERRLRANLAVFYNDYTDLQVSFYDPVYAGSRRGNAGQAHTYGAELETSAQVSEALGVHFTASHLYAIYDEYRGVSGATSDASGNQLINSPRYSIAGGFTYALDALPFAPGALRIGSDVNWTSGYFSNALNRPQDWFEGQFFLNGRLTWIAPDPNWSIEVSGRNLLDVDQPLSGTYTPTPSNINYLNYPDPRTFLISLKFEN